MIGLQDIEGARALLGGILYDVEEIAVGVHFDVIWPNPWATNDVKLFEPLYGEGSHSSEIVGALSLYDLSILQTPQAQSSVLKNVTEILRHLSLKKTTDNVPYIHFDIGVVSDSFGTFGGIGSESGSGGGYGALFALSDVKIDSPVNGQVLTYDSASGSLYGRPWVNRTLTLGGISNVNNAVDMAQNNAVLMYDSTTRSWRASMLPPSGVASVVLASGSANGTMRLDVNGSRGADVPVHGLKRLAFEDAMYVARTLAKNSSNMGNDTLHGVDAITKAASGSGDASYFFWDDTYDAWHFRGGIISDTFGTFGGYSSGSADGGVTLDGVWKSLANDDTVDYTTTTKIAIAHIPLGRGFTTSGNAINVDFGSYNGGNNITRVGTITVGTWMATPIDYTKMAPTYIGKTRTKATAANDYLLGISGFTYANSFSGSGSGAAADAYWDNTYQAWHFKGGIIADRFGTFGGYSSGSGGGSTNFATLDQVWTSLESNAVPYYNHKIHTGHIPIGPGLSIVNNTVKVNLVQNGGIQASSGTGALYINNTFVRSTHPTGLKLWLGPSSELPGIGSRDADTIYFEQDSSSGA